jgi:hypothetical protein
MDYKEVISKLEEYDITVFPQKNIDHQSGWTGENLFLKNENGFLNRRGNYTKEPTYDTIDLSGNGYCFSEESVKEAMEQVENFFLFNKVDSLETFGKYIKKNLVAH